MLFPGWMISTYCQWHEMDEAAWWTGLIIISGMYEGHRGTVEANVYQKSVDYPDTEWPNGYHVMLGTEGVKFVIELQKERPLESTRGLSFCNSGTPDGLRSHDLHLERVAS